MSSKKTHIVFLSIINQFFQTILSLGKVLIKSKTGINLPVAPSKTCIVLGNGPSLKTSLNNHPLFFTKHPLVCVNSFSTTEEYTLLKPSFYVILDPGFWFSDKPVVTSTVNSLINKTSWNVYLLIPQIARQSKLFSELEKQNPNIKITYFNYTVYKGFRKTGNWLYKNNLAMPQSQNVMVASLFLALNIGFRKIYLTGADHSWHETLMVNDENIVCAKHLHFYEGVEKPKYVPFYKGMHLNETFTMTEIFATFSKIFLGYMNVNEYTKYKHAKIYNASEISFIDAFERIKISNVESNLAN